MKFHLADKVQVTHGERTYEGRVWGCDYTDTPGVFNHLVVPEGEQPQGNGPWFHETEMVLVP